MSEAPERIWLDWPGARHGEPFYTEPPETDTQAGQTEYIRADIACALPAVQPDAAAIREAALREAASVVAQIESKHRAAFKYDFDKSACDKSEGADECLTALLALIDKPGKEEALGEMARLGQEFDAAIFSDVEGLYGDGEPRKEVSNEQVARR